MRHPHHLATTTHTVELDQLRSINTALEAAAEARSGPSLTAEQLGMTGATFRHRTARGSSREPLPSAAVLLHLTYDGPPEFPYIHGHFACAGAEGVAEMHTPALRALARELHLQQRWGV